MAHAPSSPHAYPGRVIAYTLPDGWQVLVGRTDADNDYLSFRVARPEDWWFHVRGMPGSHVLLQGPPGADADRQTLTRTAAIAAYHSKARHAGVVAGSGTRARDVTKPRGAKAGTVQIRHEWVFKVRPARGEVAGDSGNASPSPAGSAMACCVLIHATATRGAHDGCTMVGIVLGAGKPQRVSGSPDRAAGAGTAGGRQAHGRLPGGRGGVPDLCPAAARGHPRAGRLRAVARGAV